MMSPTTVSHRTPLAFRLLAIPLVLLVLLGGLWLVASVIFATYWGSIIGGVAWFVLASFLFGRITKVRPDLKLPVRGTFLATAAAAVFLFYWTSIRETEVNEDVVVGTPASAEPRAPTGPVQILEGEVESLAHSGRGDAAVVRLPNGERFLTLTDFDIDPGPMVEVRLVAGDDPDGSDYETLDDLKGSKGDQQYEIPRGVDLDRYRTVVFWCIPFTQALAEASLRAS